MLPVTPGLQKNKSRALCNGMSHAKFVVLPWMMLLMVRHPFLLETLPDEKGEID
jgi:hypothetical protein